MSFRTFVDSERLLDDAKNNDTEGDMLDIADAYVRFYDRCSEKNSTRKFDKTDDILSWRAFKATLRPCLLTLNSKFDIVWHSEILSTSKRLQWRRLPIPFKKVSPLRVLRYCTRLNSKDFCLNNDSLYNFAEMIQLAYKVAAGRLLVPDPFESASIRLSEYSDFIISDIRGSNKSLGCNENAKEAFDRRFQNIAASISLEMRNEENGKRVNGTAWSTEPVIEVTFYWLSMPIALYLVITVFFFGTVFRTRDAPPWKSSALALLRCADPKNEMASTEQFKKYAAATSVRLDDTGETWHLLETRRATGEERVRINRLDVV